MQLHHASNVSDQAKVKKKNTKEHENVITKKLLLIFTNVELIGLRHLK